MRTKPEDDGDLASLAELNAAPWMVAALGLNPGYTSWGPDEDYMYKKSEGWDSPMRIDSWKDRPNLDDLNEVVNFYFEIRRDSRKCPDCDHGYSPTAQQFSDQWYGRAPFDAAAYGATPLAADHPGIVALAAQNVERNPGYYGGGRAAVRSEADRLYRECFAGHWSHHLIQADVDALVAADRLWEFTRRPTTRRPTADEVNAWSIGGFGHDAINQHVCVRARCEREGILVECQTCGGSASIYTAPAAHLALVAWLIHPRKGASRGVEIRRIEEHEMGDVLSWLKDAATRNADRFAAAVAAASRATP